jgi:hypothetical protein
MSPTRRVIIVLTSVIVGSILSYFLYVSRRGADGLSKEDYHMLITNMVFSVGIILGIGFAFIWRKKKDL